MFQEEFRHESQVRKSSTESTPQPLTEVIPCRAPAIYAVRLLTAGVVARISRFLGIDAEGLIGVGPGRFG